MGKGDIKTRKGKLANGSFGARRKRNETMSKTVAAVVEKVATEKPKAKAKAKK